MDSAQRTQYTYTCHCQALLKHKVVALVHTSLLLDFDSSRISIPAVQQNWVVVGINCKLINFNITTYALDANCGSGEGAGSGAT